MGMSRKRHLFTAALLAAFMGISSPVYASQALELVPMCPIRCLVSKCSFLESLGSLGVYLCCSILYKNLLYFN